jgi:hypothetical protein
MFEVPVSKRGILMKKPLRDRKAQHLVTHE